MNCQEVDQFLLQTETIEIPAQIPHEIAAHIETCLHCRNNLYLTQLENEVLGNPPEVPLISPDFIQRTMQILPRDLYPAQALKESSTPVRKKKHPYRIFLQTAASVLLLAGAGLFFRDELMNLLPADHTPEIRIVAEEPAAPEESLTVAAVPETVAESGSGTSTDTTTEHSEALSPTDPGIPAAPVLHPAAYEMDSAISNNMTLAADQQPLMNPYQFAPASPYISSIAAYYQEASRSGSGGSMAEEETAEESVSVTAEPAESLPDIMLSGLPGDFTLTDFSQQDEMYTFQYQDDTQNQFSVTLIPYSSSSTPDDSVFSRLMACGDITYQVAIEGTFAPEELIQILNEIEIIK